MTLLYSINLTDKQKESITEEEATFVNLFNQFRWAFRPGNPEDHPINIFRNFDNPKGHNLIEEMIQIKKHLTGLLSKRPGSVWRGLDWSKSFQNWLIRTEPRIKPDDLKEDIVKGQQKGIQKRPYEDKIDLFLDSCIDYKCVITDEDQKTYLEYLARLKKDFDPRAVGRLCNWHFFYAGQPEKLDYMEELLRLRIQEITDNDPDIKKFIFWCYQIMKEATNPGSNLLGLLTYFFAEYVTGKIVMTKNLTKKEIKKEIKLPKETHRIETDNDYVKIQYSPDKIYTLRDIRGMIK
tara:strand:+ start:9956 stop:10834 length:879 start_codon:yes stop_codon:yes gene_type:complete